ARQVPFRKRVNPALTWFASITIASFGIAVMTTGSAAGAGVFTFGSTTSAWCSGSFSSSGSTVFMGAGAMATGTGAGVATGAAIGACFGQSSGVAMAAIMTAATG